MLLAAISSPRGWFTGIQQDSAGSRGEATRNRNHTAPSDCRLSLALHLYRLFYTAFDSSQRGHGFTGQGIVGIRAEAVSYQNYPTKKRSPCYRDALLPLPPRFHTTLQFKAPTACNRTPPRLCTHWRLPFSPRLDGAGPVPPVLSNPLSLEPTANLCHDAPTGNTPIDPAPVGVWPAPDLGPVDPDHTGDTTRLIWWCQFRRLRLVQRHDM